MKRTILTILVLFFFMVLYGQNTLSEDERIRRFEKKRDSIRQSKYGTDYLPFTVVTLEGDTITEKNLRGKVTLINFWFESCAPCMAEMPALHELYLKYQNHPEFQLLSFVREYPEDAEKCVQKLHIPYPVCPLSDKESYRLNFNDGFPTNIIIDTQGKIVLIKCGAPTEPEKAKIAVGDLEKKLRSLFVRKNEY